LAVVYQGEAHVGDTVEVDLGVGEGGERWVELYFRLRRRLRRPTSDGVEVAIAKLAIICFDYDRRSAVAFPKEVREELRYEKG
jgi:acyl-CoA thioesterase FadM